MNISTSEKLQLIFVPWPISRPITKLSLSISTDNGFYCNVISEPVSLSPPSLVLHVMKRPILVTKQYMCTHYKELVFISYPCREGRRDGAEGSQLHCITVSVA